MDGYTEGMYREGHPVNEPLEQTEMWQRICDKKADDSWDNVFEPNKNNGGLNK